MDSNEADSLGAKSIDSQKPRSECQTCLLASGLGSESCQPPGQKSSGHHLCERVDCYLVLGICTQLSPANTRTKAGHPFTFPRTAPLRSDPRWKPSSPVSTFFISCGCTSLRLLACRCMKTSLAQRRRRWAGENVCYNSGCGRRCLRAKIVRPVSGSTD